MSSSRTLSFLAVLIFEVLGRICPPKLSIGWAGAGPEGLGRFPELVGHPVFSI